MTLTPLFHRSAGFVLALVAMMSVLVAQDAPRKEGGDDFPRADHPPKAIKRVAPRYPRNMSRAGLIGQVKVAFVIDETGQVESAHALSSNNPWFERPAIDAVKQWKFEPATKAGQPVKTRTIQLIEFKLDNIKPQNFWRVPPLTEAEKLPPEFRWHKAPEPVTTVFPLYPFEALRAKQKGRTHIRFMVGPDGRIAAATVLEASAPEFGQAALAMVDRWRFKPARLADGSPACAMLSIEHEFTPNGTGDVPVTDEALAILRRLEKNPDSIVGWTELDRAPKPVWQHAPVYPTALREKGEAGNAQIEFFVDENGDAQLPRIVEASAPEFGYAAAQAVATWRFEPPLKDGKPVCSRVRVPLVFTLKDGPAKVGTK
jgi:TonB family protein